MANDQGSPLPESRKTGPRNTLAEKILSDWGMTTRTCVLVLCIVGTLLGSLLALLIVSAQVGLGFALLGTITTMIHCYFRRGPGSGPASAAVAVPV
jgi:hypothetical protein